MANFKTALDKVFDKEFSSPKNALHQNSTENGLTYKGIYESAHPDLLLWDFVKDEIIMNNNDIEKASEVLFTEEIINVLVEDFYEAEFWNKMKLDDIVSQNTAEEIFMLATNIGIRNASKIAQRIVGTKDDGYIGTKTIESLNGFDSDKFDIIFDDKELVYYDKLIAENEDLSIYRKGWHNRARYI